MEIQNVQNIHHHYAYNYSVRWEWLPFCLGMVAGSITVVIVAIIFRLTS